jgi:hypothetical protein
MDVALLGLYLRAQPPKLLIILTTLFAHTRSIDLRGSGPVASCRIASHSVHPRTEPDNDRGVRP